MNSSKQRKLWEAEMAAFQKKSRRPYYFAIEKEAYFSVERNLEERRQDAGAVALSETPSGPISLFAL